MSVPAFAQKQGGTLSGPIITTAFVENFNPYTQNPNRNPAPGFMYEPMVVYNFRQDSIEYRLADSFEYSDDLMSITYHLREGLKWSDGKPLTADDVIFSFELAQKYAGIDVAGLFQGETPKVKSVEKVDDNTVRFNLSVVDTTVEWFIPGHFIVPKHIWEGVEDPAKFDNLNPVGSGPLTDVQKVTPQQMNVCRNKHYWEEGRPYIDCLRLRQYQGNDQVQAALLRGEIDWGSNFIPDIEKTFVAKDPENNHFWYPAGSPVAIHLNTAKKPFDDLAFRQAFSVALDREEIVDLATYGYAVVNPHITGIGDFFEGWYDDAVNEKYDWLNEFDPDKAIEILDNAGYKDVDGDGMRENKDGSPLEFSIMVVNGWTDWVQSVQMVTEYLQQVGIQAKTKAVEWGQYDAAWKSQDFDAGILWGGTGVSPIRFYGPLLHSNGKGVTYEANHGFSSPEVDALVDAYSKTIDNAEHRKIINQLQEVVAENLMIIPIFSNPTWYQYSTKNIVGWPTEENPFINPNFYDAGERVIMINNLSQK
jgi:peptide/nickel transport system substrate-binding protein